MFEALEKDFGLPCLRACFWYPVGAAEMQFFEVFSILRSGIHVAQATQTHHSGCALPLK